jgi:uracil-DNA glycosylase
MFGGVASRPRLAYAGPMSDRVKDDPVAALAWLLESGGEEAVGEAPVNRFNANPPPPLNVHPPLVGGSKTRSVLGEGAAHRPAPLPPAHSPPPQVEPDSITTAQALAAAATTLAELKTALEGFDGCGLKKSAQHTVFADGNPASRLLFIGEAPGAEEDRQGIPFVGRAGQLLDKMLAAIGRDRSSAYITNVLNWRPPQNRDPAPEEAAMCLPFLRRHIELVNPGIIVLLGAVAARHVLGLNDGIMRLRGRWLGYRVGDVMIPVMATLHPAYLLRQPAHKKLAWRDLQAVEEKLQSLGLLEKTSTTR